MQWNTYMFLNSTCQTQSAKQSSTRHIYRSYAGSLVLSKPVWFICPSLFRSFPSSSSPFSTLEKVGGGLQAREVVMMNCHSDPDSSFLSRSCSDESNWLHDSVNVMASLAPRLNALPPLSDRSHQTSLTETPFPSFVGNCGLSVLL